MTEHLIAIEIFSTFFMTGLIYFVQVVHYPLFAHVAVDSFPSYHKQHMRRTSFVVLPPMVLELLSATALIFVFPIQNIVLQAIALGSLVLIWASTFFLQVPLHAALAKGFDATVISRLVRSNWLRIILWSVRSVILSYLYFWPTKMSAL